LNRLEALRSTLGNKKIVVTSGYRCPIHNKKVGGVKGSQHLYGKAVDIKVVGVSVDEVARAARKEGFSFVKKYSSWVHIDVRDRT
jgi:zinc D-Ala-D-Ala carboxypeptidase